MLARWSVCLNVKSKDQYRGKGTDFYQKALKLIKAASWIKKISLTDKNLVPQHIYEKKLKNSYY
jgi:hypothetical protein